MIELVQHKFNEANLYKDIIKKEAVELKINESIIDKDLDRLHEFSKKSTNVYDKKNIDTLIAYLKKLKGLTNDGSLEICWSIKTGNEIPSTYPIQLISEKAYGINTSNYIEVENNQKLVEIDLTELADIIAFEFMYKDLGEDHDSIEELLNECGIATFEDSSILSNFFKENDDKIFELSRSLKIGDTPYFSYETKKVKDYFHSKDFKTREYKDVVEYSCKYANTAIADAIIKNSIHNGIDVDIVSISATALTLIINSAENVNIKEELLEEISVRSFGRRFIIEPKIEIF